MKRTKPEKSDPSEGCPLLRQEWRKLLARLRRTGAQATCDHVLELMPTTKYYPLALTIGLARHLLTRGDQLNAGRLIKSLKAAGANNPLLDKVQVRWLWDAGKFRTALIVALRSAEYWNRSYLFSVVGNIYDCLNMAEESPYYRRKSKHYHKQALLAQEREASSWESVDAIRKRYRESKCFKH
jgi:hypothetical protein